MGDRADRQTERQRQTDRETETDRQTDRQRQTSCRVGRLTDETFIARVTGLIDDVLTMLSGSTSRRTTDDTSTTDRYLQTDRHNDTQTDRHTDRQTDKSH